MAEHSLAEAKRGNALQGRGTARLSRAEAKRGIARPRRGKAGHCKAEAPRGSAEQQLRLAQQRRGRGRRQINGKNDDFEIINLAVDFCLQLLDSGLHHFNRWLYIYIDQIDDSRLIDISK